MFSTLVPLPAALEKHRINTNWILRAPLLAFLICLGIVWLLLFYNFYACAWEEGEK